MKKIIITIILIIFTNTTFAEAKTVSEEEYYKKINIEKKYPKDDYHSSKKWMRYNYTNNFIIWKVEKIKKIEVNNKNWEKYIILVKLNSVIDFSWKKVNWEYFLFTESSDIDIDIIKNLEIWEYIIFDSSLDINIKKLDNTILNLFYKKWNKYIVNNSTLWNISCEKNKIIFKKLLNPNYFFSSLSWETYSKSPNSAEEITKSLIYKSSFCADYEKNQKKLEKENIRKKLIILSSAIWLFLIIILAKILKNK